MKALLGLLAAVPLLAQQGVNTYSPEKERAMGAAFAQEVRRQGVPFENAEVIAYVQRVGDRLRAQLPEGAPAFRFEVIRIDSATEPIPFPGGIVLVPVSALLQAQSEAEFAGMLAHAMGHVVLRHGTGSATRGKTADFATIPLVFPLHLDSRQVAAALLPSSMVNARRAQELEADQYGVELAGRAGFDAAAYREYLRRTQPASAERIVALDRLIERRVPEHPGGGDEFVRMQEAVRAEVKPVSLVAPTLRR